MKIGDASVNMYGKNYAGANNMVTAIEASYSYAKFAHPGNLHVE